MKIKASTWNSFVWIAAVTTVPVGLFLSRTPEWGTASNVYLAFLGLMGALVAVLMRLGVVVFAFSPSDRRTSFYRISRSVAAREKLIWGDLFSQKYYDAFLEETDSPTP